jgi:hypothetical protein|tara:strand:+ start:1500 stop:1754 length:255 start_codon:yes stop_codon:yes gene_type:complete
MTNTQYEIIDALYFVTPFNELVAQLDLEKELLVVELHKLHHRGWIRVYDGIDQELENHALLNDRFEKYQFLASKQGLIVHNSDE